MPRDQRGRSGERGTTIPVIDLFAGPGGLGEGFSAFAGRGIRFRIKLSIEKDPAAHRTLLLRSFFREFERGCVPDAYYAYLRDDEPNREKLFEQFPAEYSRAKLTSIKAELGVTADEEIDAHITRALGHEESWVLIGGPPCQAYSIVGRSRMSRKREKHEADHRHYLYLEYLRVLARYRPPVFVMENVKGLLSSEVKGSRTFDQMRADLSAPVRAIKDVCAATVPRGKPAEYRIYSLIARPGHQQLKPAEYVICSERFGIPQKRHRVILLGVRTDLTMPPALGLIPQEELAAAEVLDDLPVLRSRLSREPDLPAAWRGCLRQAWAEGRFACEDRNLLRCIKKAIEEMEQVGDDSVGGRFVPASEGQAYPALREWFIDDRLAGYCNHETRYHIREDLARYMFVSCFGRLYGFSPRLHEFPRALLPDHENVEAALREKHNYFSDRFKVQLADAPATTVTSHLAKDGHYFIHHDSRQCRTWTVREAARIQTFPDNYFFEGTRTDQYRQVGNAVPPLLARQIAAEVAAVLESNLTRPQLALAEAVDG